MRDSRASPSCRNSGSCEALRNYMEEREWLRTLSRTRGFELDHAEQDRLIGEIEGGQHELKKHLQPLTPAALYARVSSDRQDVDLSVSAQLRALKEYARANGYSVAREYVDEAESGRVADRPQFREMIEEGGKPEGPLRRDSRMEIQPLHPQARARRSLQVPAAAQGHQSGVHHRAGRGQRHRQAA